MGSVAWSEKSGVRLTLCAWIIGMVVAIGGSPSLAVAQNEPSPMQLLEDFNHYMAIANYELAEANARALLDRGLSPAQFVGLIEERTRLDAQFDEMYRRALLVPQLEGVASELYSLYDEGIKGRARSLDQINRNVDKLQGMQRERILARERLKEAGEYAVPSLLEAVLRGQGVDIRAEAVTLLQEMGPDAVVPLSQALLSLDPVDQEIVCRMLGSMTSRTSLPYLYDLRQTTDVASVQAAAEDAIRRIAGLYDPAVSVAGLYRQLAERYLADRHQRTMHAFPGETHQLLWNWIPGVGLEPVAIVSALYNEAMAMRAAERALELDPGDPLTLAVWISANFAREQSTPEGYDNPVYGPERREAMFYAVASGAGPLQRVLGRALLARETVTARRAIEALSRSTGGAGLWSGLGEERPLVDAMSYGDRRVEYDAALALGQANPRESFSGSDRVVPILAGLVRDAGSRFALVIAEDAERQQSLRSALSGAGYTVLAPTSSLASASGVIAQAPGVDLIVMELPTNRTLQSIQEVRRTTRLAATPVLALLPVGDVTRYRSTIADDHLTRLVRTGVNAEQVAESAQQLAVSSGGEPLTTEEAEAYALRSLAVLHDIALSGNETLSVRDAAGALISALGATEGEIRAQVASVMSAVGSRRAQQALFDAAVESGDDERVMLLTATADSAKRFGNLLDQAQVRRLLTMVTEAEGSEATAAAALMGALNLPNDQLVPLILRGG